MAGLRASCALRTPRSQEEINLEKKDFRERFGENPRKEDLTILVPRQDDPTEQVGQRVSLHHSTHGVGLTLSFR